jgi:hypothetical protein
VALRSGFGEGRAAKLTGYIASSAFVAACLPTTPVFVQYTLQIGDTVKVKLIPLAVVDRPSKLAGSTVMIEVNEVLRTSNGLIVAPGHTVLFAVIPVGG